MDFKIKNIYFILLGVVLLFALTGCPGEGAGCPSSYRFKIPAQVFPQKDTFKIGDTLTMVSEFSDRVYELETEREYLLENFDFWMVTNLRKIDSVQTIDGFTPNELIIDSVYLNTERSYFNNAANVYYYYLNYKYENNKYVLHCKVVLKEVGLYRFMIGSTMSLAFPSQDFPGKECPKRDNEGIMYVNERENNNYELLQYAKDENKDIKLEKFNNSGSFAFVVVE